MAKAKGMQAGRCCCGGCWSPPADARVASTARIIDVQQYCCRCIPEFLCVTVVEENDYGDYSSLLQRVCDGTAYDGGPIQFRGNIVVHDQLVQMIIRLEVRDGECWIVWEVEDEGWIEEKKIDHTKPASVYECDFGMASEDCVHFGGQWDMPDNITVIIGMPETLDIQELIECAGCSCMCRCMCVSIWSRDVANEIEFTGQNEIGRAHV